MLQCHICMQMPHRTCSCMWEAFCRRRQAVAWHRWRRTGRVVGQVLHLQVSASWLPRGRLALQLRLNGLQQSCQPCRALLRSRRRRYAAGLPASTLWLLHASGSPAATAHRPAAVMALTMRKYSATSAVARACYGLRCSACCVNVFGASECCAAVAVPLQAGAAMHAAWRRHCYPLLLVLAPFAPFRACNTRWVCLVKGSLPDRLCYR